MGLGLSWSMKDTLLLKEHFRESHIFLTQSYIMQRKVLLLAASVELELPL